MNVVLIGFSCSGKSSVGRALAELLGWEFVDTDEEVERAAGRRIERIFAEEGEAAFRRMEEEAVRQALSAGPRVVAVGGGAVMNPVSRRAMRDGHLVVLLDAEVETIHRRLMAAEADTPRPLLASADPRERIRRLKSQREAIYREAAHLRLSTDGDGVQETVERLRDVVRRRIEEPFPDEGVER